MFLLNPRHNDRPYPDPRSRDIMARTIAFFEKKGLDRLKDDLLMLRPPQARWQDLQRQSAELLDGLVPGDLPVSGTAAQDALFLPLRCADHGDPFALIIQLHRLLKEKIRVVPNTLFVGGPLEQPGLALFTRPLNIADFARMWQPLTAI